MSLGVKNLFDVSGKVVLISGAAGGLGEAASKGFAEAGAKVMLNGRNEKTLKELADTIRKAGGTCEYCVGDPTIHEDVKKVVAATKKAFGGIDILVPIAGFNKTAPIVDQPVEEWQAIMDANVKGTYLFCKEVGKVLIEQNRGGKVILISSTRSELGMANYSGYSPSKGAVNLLAKTLATEWGKYKINVNAMAPTVFRTKLTEWMWSDAKVYENFLRRIPIGRLAEPEDFIGTLLYLSSKASDFVTGVVLYVDGGYTAG